MTNFDALILRLLRSEVVEWIWSSDRNDVVAFLEQCNSHGVSQLIYYFLVNSGSISRWPPEITDKLAFQARQQAAAEILRIREVGIILEQMSISGISGVLFKGVPLGFQIYPYPELRQKSDTDIFFHESDRETVTQVLLETGYHEQLVPKGKRISYQVPYIKADINHTIFHNLDVHWKISNAQYFADKFTFEEVNKKSVCVPELGPYAKAFHPVHALLLACFHRVVHFHQYQESQERFIWLYDVHLLSEMLSDYEWDDFISMCRIKSISATCLNSLEASRKQLGTFIPENVIKKLSVESIWTNKAETAILSVKNPTDQLWANLRALPFLSDKLTYIKERVFPSQKYMLDRYNSRNKWYLPVLYLNRLARIFLTMMIKKIKSLLSNS